jgi:hypothetical protein
VQIDVLPLVDEGKVTQLGGRGKQIESIMSEGRINKMADTQGTKFLRLFGLTNVNY